MKTKIKMQFDVEVAKDVGTDSAIILSNIEFWVFTNETRGSEKHHHKNKYWTYNSAKAFQEQFPYLTEKQIRYCLKKLEDSGYIETGNFNQHNYDRTKWYSLKSKKPVTKLGNGSHKNVTPIPDNKPDNKPYNSKAEILKTYMDLGGFKNGPHRIDSIEKNKKETLYKDFVKTYNYMFDTRKRSTTWGDNCDYWLKKYSYEEIKDAIVRMRLVKWWGNKDPKDPPTLDLLFMIETKKGKKLDLIDYLLNLPEPKIEGTLRDSDSKLIDALASGYFNKKGGENNG